MRLFVAIDLSEDLHEALHTHIRHLKSVIESNAVRWVNPAGIHLTLKFLGETPPNQIEAISNLLTKVSNQYSPFMIHVGTFGCFPNWIKPRVFWIGVTEPEGKLENLQSALEVGFHEMGYPKEGRKFHPHLTLARIRQKPRSSGRLDEITDPLEKVHIGELGCQQVNEFCLFQSELRPDGAVYTKLGVYPLGKAR